MPDPRSRRQPAGVHERSRIFDPAAYEWSDDGWTGRQLAGSVIYELHLGTFTPEGTLDAAAARLDHLVELGIDLVELLPVNAFNGTHNWGYDGVLWGVVDEEYGGPAAYQRFVDAAHAVGLGVVQDVVHNHLGPSGNYLPVFGPYVKTEGANTWGSLVNLDGEGSAEVRRYILDSVRMWFADYHVDGLRLDAVHALSDNSETHLLEEMADRGRRTVGASAASAHADRGVRPERRADGHPARGGRSGHRRAVERRLPPRRARRPDGETSGYYADFEPLAALAKVCERGFFHDGTYSSFRGRDHGVPIDTATMPTWRLVVRQPEPRPGRQPRRRRPAQRAPRRGPARVRGAAHAGRPVHADAVPGRGVGRVHAVPVLHLAPRARARRGDGGGTPHRVRADGLGPGRRTRSAGPRDLRALEAGLVGGRRRACTCGCSRRTSGSSSCAARCPR